jgi:hypothetical protein
MNQLLASSSSIGKIEECTWQKMLLPFVTAPELPQRNLKKKLENIRLGLPSKKVAKVLTKKPGSSVSWMKFVPI